MRHFQPSILNLGVVFLAMTLVFAGCSEPTIDEEDALRFAEEWSATVEDHLREEALRAAASEALLERMEAARTAEDRQTQRDEPPFERIVFDVYQARDFEPVLIDDDGLTAHGQAVWEALQYLEDHRLDAEPYGLEAIEAALTRRAEQMSGVADFDALQATDEDRRGAVEWLMEQQVSAFELSSDNYTQLTQTIFDDERRGQRLRQAVEDYQQQRASIAESGAEIEHGLARATARFAREQRHFRIKEIFVHPRHWDYYNEGDVANSGRRPDPQRGAFLAGQIWRDAAHLTESIAEANRVEILHKKIGESLAEFLESDDPRATFDAIAPRQPQYAGLVAEYRRYRDIVDAGGWEEVTQRNIRAGQTHETVGQLKRRLQIEGYFPPDIEITDLFDDDLTEAIRTYQETHQMPETGAVYNLFWSSLNVPAERRLAQIGINIERWRDTNIQHELPTYVFVNVPDFTVELWHEQERVMRFATVVGDNERSLNPLTDEMEYSNRTPTPMSAYIDRVIFNPYWNVTDRIRAVRILPQVRQSLERKYALRLYEMHEQATARQETTSRFSRGGLASLRIGSQSDESTDGSDAADGTDEEALAPEPELTEEELRAQRVERAFAQFSSVRSVRDEGSDRAHQRRVFDLAALERLQRTVYGDDEDAQARFRARLPYLDWETGQVDVENTDLDNVPSWYEANGYDVVRHGTWEYVRMLPGPENALGDVKIIFPNYDNIYLHDTPARSLFNRSVRGFSHGCIRLAEPLLLSEALLELGGIEDFDIPAILADGGYMPIFLKRQIPVYLEYYTVRVDDEGRANFLADIYRYDAALLGEDT